MIRLILWKECREQRAVWVALVVLAAGLLIGLPVIFAADFDRHGEARQALAFVGFVLTWAYGMVCGAMLLAGEGEAQTQPFLDALPGGRGRVWVAKCLAGAVLVAAFAAVVAVLVKTSLAERVEWPVGLVLAIVGGVGFGWGLYTSAFARTVLGAVGLAIALQAVFFQVAVMVGTTIGLFAEGAVPLLLVVFVLACLAFPLPLSAFRYARVDRQRLREETSHPPFLRDFRLGLRVSLWLAGRQVWGLAKWLLPLAFAFGLLCIPQPLVFWPCFTLVLGAISGVTCFLDEQAGPRQFLGEQRFPLGTIWCVKVTVRLLFLLAALVVAISPLLVLLLIDLGSRAHDPQAASLSGRLFRSVLVGLTVPAGVILFAPALTGFAVGLVSGVVFRKAFIAGMAGVALALAAFGVWVPGLIAGGVPGWQVFALPAVLLVAARLLMRPWTAGRLLTRRVVVAMIGLVAGCVTILGLGLWWRVASVPDTPEPPALAAMLARMTDEDHNEAGRLIRSTLAAIETRRREWNAEKPTKPLRPREGPPGPPHALSYAAQMSEVFRRGWPDRAMDQIELAGWIDRIFADDVWKQLDRLPTLPLGIVDDPRRSDVASRYDYLETAIRVAELLAIRGLQMQERGEPDVFVRNLEIVLALVRNLQNASIQLAANYARGIELRTLAVLDQWLAGLSGRPDLLRRAGEALRLHRTAMDSNRDHDLADYLVERNTMNYSGDVISPAGWRLGTASVVFAEADLFAITLQIPWERERQQRLLRRSFFSSDALTLPERFVVPARPLDANVQAKARYSWLTRLDASRLVVALRLHQTTIGKPATDLNQLVPASIDAIPQDPYSGRPFGYRLSSGDDVIEGMWTIDETGTPIVKTRKIPAGQGILWSVGPDRVDDEGKVFGMTNGDLIFLVPLEKK